MLSNRHCFTFAIVCTLYDYYNTVYIIYIYNYSQFSNYIIIIIWQISMHAFAIKMYVLATYFGTISEAFNLTRENKISSIDLM